MPPRQIPTGQGRLAGRFGVAPGRVLQQMLRAQQSTRIYSITHPLTRSQKYPPSQQMSHKHPVFEGQILSNNNSEKSCKHLVRRASARQDLRGFSPVAAARHSQSGRAYTNIVLIHFFSAKPDVRCPIFQKKRVMSNFQKKKNRSHARRPCFSHRVSSARGVTSVR